jgi:hypothetical protein
MKASGCRADLGLSKSLVPVIDGAAKGRSNAFL